MDIISAYREVGSYHGAAAVCDTAANTIKRVIARHEASGVAPVRATTNNYDPVTELGRVSNAWSPTRRAGSQRHACRP